MTNANPILPVNGDDEREDAPTAETDATLKVGGDRVLDPDANDDLVDSAQADRLAAGDPEEG